MGIIVVPHAHPRFPKRYVRYEWDSSDIISIEYDVKFSLYYETMAKGIKKYIGNTIWMDIEYIPSLGRGFMLHVVMPGEGHKDEDIIDKAMKNPAYANW